MSPVDELRKSKDKSRILAGIENRKREAAILLAEAYGLENFLKKNF